jgi:hypothetical protein
MAGWSDWYSGDMAPPLRQPGGGYSPAPATQPQMSPEEIYQGIYGEPLQLTSRSVKSVPVPTQATTDGRFGLGAGVRASGDAAYQSPKVFVPNALPGPDPVAKSQDRLPAMPAGLPLKSDVPGFASARGSLGAGGFGNGSVTMSPRFPSAAAPDDGVIDLSSLEMSDRGAQNTADSEGKPVRTKSGKVYYPGGKAPGGAVSGSLKSNDNRGPLGQMLGMKGSGGLGGLLSGLFGGGQQQMQGGGLGAMLGMVPGAGVAAQAAAPNPGYVTTPFQEDRFQTTTGAVMPSSMNNSRWTTGY